jgi:hypothetical protein
MMVFRLSRRTTTMADMSRSVPVGATTEPNDKELFSFLIEQHERAAKYYKIETLHYNHQWCTGSFGKEVLVKAEENRKLWMMHECSLRLLRKISGL